MVARTPRGLEEILADELRALGAEAVEIQNRAVSFRGDQVLLYRANLCLRTALRILKPVHSFRIVAQQDLYHRLREYNWSRHLTVDTTFAIDSAVHSPVFTNSLFAAQKAKDAIVDQFRDRTGRRPSVDTRDPGLRLHLHISNRDCAVSLDSSGQSLHRRGYRTEALEAPLNEVLGAGLVLASGWNGETPFVDPMCGSGTIAIEAALRAANIAPGLLREHFAFMSWGDFDAKLWARLRERALGERRTPAGPVHAADIDKRAVQVSQANRQRAGLAEDAILFTRAAFADFSPPAGPGVLVMNPPYGERMQPEDTFALYKSIGDGLKQKYTGYTAFILSSNLDALKKIGLKPSRKMTVHNGPLECSFRRYELYAGSRE